jgi:cytochrome P450
MRPEDWAIVLLPLVHRDPAAWGEGAAEFDPDRFLPERSEKRNPHAYKPFGTGERACIGRQFALHEAVLVLARLRDCRATHHVDSSVATRAADLHLRSCRDAGP